MIGEFLVYTSLPAALGAILGELGAESGSEVIGPYSGGAAGAALGSLLFLISRLAKDKKNKEHASGDVGVIVSKDGEPIIVKTKNTKKTLKSSLPPELILSRAIHNI